MQDNQINKTEAYIDVIKKLQLIENSMDLKTFHYKGVDLWPLLKYQLGTMYFDDLDSRKDKLLSYWNRVLAKVKLMIKNNQIANILGIFYRREEYFDYQECNYLFLSDEYSKRVLLNKKWIDVFIYPFIKMKSIKESEYIILRSNQNQSKIKPSFTKEFNISSLILRSFLESRLVLKNQTRNNPELLEYFNNIKRLFDIDSTDNKFPKFKDLISEAQFINELSLKFENIIAKVRPKEVIVTHYLGYVTAAICIAAKRKGVLVSDIQHGVQGSLHPAYNFRNFPVDGYNSTPERYYVWNNSDSENLSLWSENESLPETEVIGNPVKYLLEEDVEMIELFSGDFEFAIKDHLHKQLILVTLCWAYYIPDIFLDVISRSNENTFFLIRFHPSTTEYEKKVVKEKLRKLNSQNYEFEKSSEIPLHIIFKYVDIHLGIVSTAILEGIEYGIQTIATGSRAKAYYDNKNKEDCLSFSDCPKEISNIIIKNQKQKTFLKSGEIN